MELFLLTPALKYLATGAAAGLFGAGSWVIAQTNLIDQPIEAIGGGILITTALVSLALVLRAGSFERKSATNVVTQLNNRIDTLETDLEVERTRSARLLIAYDRERELRISLEHRGATDRRQGPTPSAPMVTEQDYHDLADKVADTIASPEIPLDDTTPS